MEIDHYCLFVYFASRTMPFKILLSDVKARAAQRLHYPLLNRTAKKKPSLTTVLNLCARFI